MNGNVERESQVIPATGVIILAPANYFFLETATLPVAVSFQGNGQNYRIASVSAGILVGRVNGWGRAVISGTVGSTVTWYYGDAALREDVTDFRSQLIGGITAVSEAPSSTIVTPAAVAVTTGNAGAIAANAARKRITVKTLLANTGNLYLQAPTAGAGRGIEMVPGDVAEVSTTAAMDMRNDSGATQSFTTFEES